jgi:hypothetical protein
MFEVTDPKVNELAPLTKYGSCCPPAPVLFNAFQIPGWVNEIKPRIITLNSGLRNHLVSLDTDLGALYTSWSESSLAAVTASLGS